MRLNPGFIEIVNDARSRVRECAVEDVIERAQKGEAFYLVDVREDDEWRAGHAQGAIHIGKGVIERDIEATIPDKDASIILHCSDGFRSALAAEALHRMGYKGVVSMDGGMQAWRGAGLPEEK